MSKKIKNNIPPKIFLKETVLGFLKSIGRPVSIDSFLKIAHLPRKNKREIETLLSVLEAEGKVLHVHGNWHVATKSKVLRGIFSLQKNGAGFVSLPQAAKGDIYIAPEYCGGAWDGDTVEISLLPGRRGPSAEGRVVIIVEKNRSELAVHAVKRMKNGMWTCTPLHPGLHSLFTVDPKEQDVTEGDLLLVRAYREKSGPVLDAELITNLHNEKTPQAQELLTKANNAVPSVFPPSVLQEATALSASIGPSELEAREDLRHLPFVTIDGPDAKDFDDAVLVEKLPDGYRLLVGIADVSYYVKPSSALDKEAFLRGNSYYFPLSVEPMLPEVLSNGLCSLRPDEDRLVMVADMVFTETGKETSARFYQGVIQSKARLTYDQVKDALLENNEESRNHLGPVLPMLENALELAKALSTMRKNRGCLELEIPETMFVFTENRSVSSIIPRQHHFIHQLIEEFMVAANEAVARFLTSRQEPMMYRVHPAPDQDKLTNLVRFLQAADLIPPLVGGKKKKKDQDPLTVSDLGKILVAAKGSSYEYVVSRLILRSMMQARYSPENEGHFGLGSPCYCHFTSPIRRYADLLVHRSLKKVLKAKGVEGYDAETLQKKADCINATERTAMEAEREIRKRLSVLFMADKIGEDFTGIISGVSDIGIFVEIPSCMAEGMVRLSSLGDDYYEYIPEYYMLKGISSGKKYQIGQEVTATLVDVSLGRLEITFAFPESISARKPGRKTAQPKGKTAQKAGKTQHKGKEKKRRK